MFSLALDVSRMQIMKSSLNYVYTVGFDCGGLVVRYAITGYVLSRGN